MTLGGFLLLLLIAGICGSVAQSIAVGYSHGRCAWCRLPWGSWGAITLGTWLAGVLGVGEILNIQIGGQSFPIVWSIIGAALFVALLALLRPRPYV